MKPGFYLKHVGGILCYVWTVFPYLFYSFILFAAVFCLHMYVYFVHAWNRQCQKRYRIPLELELWVVVTFHMGDGN